MDRHSARLSRQNTGGMTPSATANASHIAHGVGSGFIAKRQTERFRDSIGGFTRINAGSREFGGAHPAQRSENCDEIACRQMRQPFAKLGQRSNIERRFQLRQSAKRHAEPARFAADPQQHLTARAVRRLTHRR